MTYALKTANARFLATSSTSIEVAAKAAANVGLPKDDVFLLEGELPGHTTIRQLISMGQNYGNDQTHSVPIPVGKKNKDVCAFLSFSSGTTGLPKAVCICCSAFDPWKTRRLTGQDHDLAPKRHRSGAPSDANHVTRCEESTGCASILPVSYPRLRRRRYQNEDTVKRIC